MSIQKRFFTPLEVLQIFIFLAAAFAYNYPVNGLESPRKLDESNTTSDQSVKCTPSCVQSPPPPSPPPPSPPPPALPPPSPPSPKKPPTPYCPPPPSSIIYITGPPGNIYPIDSDFGGAIGRKIPAVFPALIASGILGLLAFW
ncbi:Hydroxyproline-rich glycoprotein family protein [Melia azedarach]|uniref:Hydroxyproline-rich glycoprotein family protein n=1 Tax=Melia azedarach TaxID=155640 RepID=A0ACC1XET8_MELAZ|nr:Hydroxyproline-rich glycoprotein family protein [Melia azedarach]